jgi:hypothetical protein
LGQRSAVSSRGRLSGRRSGSSWVDAIIYVQEESSVDITSIYKRVRARGETLMPGQEECASDVTHPCTRG